MEKITSAIKFLYNHKTYNIVLFIPFFVLLFLYISNERKKDNVDLEKNGCFTIAKTVGTHYQIRRGWLVDYEYYYNNIKYYDYKSYGKLNIKKNGGFYLVKISKISPQNNQLYLDEEIENPEYTTLPSGDLYPCNCKKDSFLIWYKKW